MGIGMSIQDEELALLKSEHKEIKGTLNEISMRIASNEQVTMQIATEQKVLSEALKSHFDEEREMKDAQRKSNDDIHKMRDILQDIKTQLVASSLETHKMVEGKLNDVYNRIRASDEKFNDFRAGVEKEHAQMMRDTEKNTMERVFKHVTSLWAVGLVCGALVAYIFNEHTEDFDNHVQQCESRYKQMNDAHNELIRKLRK